nr:MAG TPA: hypothetical protein [Caudoviricetes sp.]
MLKHGCPVSCLTRQARASAGAPPFPLTHFGFRSTSSMYFTTILTCALTSG